MDTRKVNTAIPRLLIRLYQVMRAGSVRRCRFYPTCSDYMVQAMETKGLCSGLWSGFLRILKCHPWHPGGYDPLINSDLRVQGSEISLSSEPNSLTRNL